MASRLEQTLIKLGLAALYPAFRREKIDDSLLADLTDSDLREIGVLKLGDRKRLLAAFARGGESVTATPVQPFVPPPAPGASQNIAAKKAGRGFSDHPISASLENPFLNSLGMPFVPITRCKTLFCVWQLRISDYEQFCLETGAKRALSDFPQTPDHPVVNVMWTDAHEFCEWLTRREKWLGLISPTFVYRLPKDEEWSAAVGLPHEHAFSARARSGVIEGYPWGPNYPPPPGAGNYHARLGVDEFQNTSPVGSFTPNKFGLYDLGGNVWEWCMDEFEKGSSYRVLRGASCFNDDPELLMSSCRDKLQPNSTRNNIGIRVVLASMTERDPWYKA